MPRRNPRRAARPLPPVAARDCPFGCGRVITGAQAACGPDWAALPAHLKRRWAGARRGGDPGDIDDARAAIARYAEQQLGTREGGSR